MSEPATLAAHIDRHSETILAHWREAVENLGDVPEADRLTREEFLDHVPALLDRLAERLRGGPGDVVEEGKGHGRLRWRQGYDIAAVVREMSQLRASLAKSTAVCAGANGWDILAFRDALDAVNDVLDEATAESVAQFQDDGREQARQALAEAKARQHAIEEAWIDAQIEKAKLRAVLRNLPAAVWVFDPEGTVIGVNDEAERLTGVGKEAVTGKLNIFRLGPEYVVQRLDGSAYPGDRLPAVRALAGEVVQQEEFVWVLRGEPRTVSVNAAPMHDSSGKCLGAVVVLIDVTLKKRDEDHLRHERDVSRTVTDTVAEGLFMTDAGGRVTFANPAALRMLGWPSGELVGLPLRASVRARDPSEGRGSGGGVLVAGPSGVEEDPIDRALRTGETVWGDEEFVRRDGSRFVAEYTASPIVSGGRIVGLVQAFHDVTGRKKLEAELAASEARFRVTVEKSPVMIWRTDSAGRCEYANQTWVAFRGVAPGGRDVDWAEAIHPDDRDRCVASLQDAFARRATFECSYRVRRHDGFFRWVNDLATPLYDAAGSLQGYLGSCLDINARIELEHALEQQRVMAEESSKQKTRLVSALSHDARTPLNAVALAAQLLEVHFHGEPDDEVRDCLRTIRLSVRNVLDLLGDHLNLSKIDAGAMPVEESRFALDPVIGECVASVETQARVKGLEVTLDPGPLAGVSLQTDRSKLKQVLCNLLSNALRYTNSGWIKVTGALAGDQVRIAVADSGVGIARESWEKIFDEFAVLEKPDRPVGEGTGLGLAICRRLANLLKGEIELESAPGVGSVFTLVLPASVLTDGSSPSDGGVSLTADDRNADRVRDHARNADLPGAVLVVEDHVDSRQTLGRVLKRMGFRVLEAGNGRDALAMARAEPDLRVILMDVNMPVMDGVEATRALRADPRLRDVVIFALTGDVTLENQNRIADAGVNGFLEKPVTWEALRDALALSGHEAAG